MKKKSSLLNLFSRYRNIKIFGSAIIGILSLFSAFDAKTQDCCVGGSFSGSLTWYCIANMSGCDASTTCTGAVLDAAFGITGNWVATPSCNAIADCSSTACTGMNTLPVELKEFRVKYIDKVIDLYWTTASELNNEGFEIQYSIDGANWEPIAFVEGYGTSFRENQYSYTHQNPVIGFNYYRLKQIDYNGAFGFSPTKVALWQGSSIVSELKLAVMPNPVSEWMTVALPQALNESGTLDFYIYDQTGRLVRSETKEINKDIRFELNDLSSGFYVLEARKNGFKYSARFVKQAF